MNVLLWRAEIAGRNNIGSPVPLETVWQKMITAPDQSALEIRHHGKKLGFCRWIPTIGERKDVDGVVQGDSPEGMVKETMGYDIDVSGNVERRSEMVARANGRMTVPQIFIGATHVGGYDDLYALDRAGRLDALLAGARLGGELLGSILARRGDADLQLAVILVLVDALHRRDGLPPARVGHVTDRQMLPGRRPTAPVGMPQRPVLLRESHALSAKRPCRRP